MGMCGLIDGVRFSKKKVCNHGRRGSSAVRLIGGSTVDRWMCYRGERRAALTAAE